MSSFLEKLKGLTNHEKNENEETPKEETISQNLEPVEFKDAEPIKKKQKKQKRPATEETESETEIISAKITAKPTTEISTALEKMPEKISAPKTTGTKEKKWPEPEGQLAVDVYQTENELVIQSAVAGIKPENLDIVAQGDTVIIKGNRENTVTEEKNYFYQECYWGKFSREIILPVEADVSRAEATMTDGILTIRMPKIEKDKKKKIIIR